MQLPFSPAQMEYCHYHATTPRRQRSKIVVIVGPTGCGKSRLSIDLATRFFPSEVVNSDKIPVYCGLDITTNKIPMPDRRGVPHHLLGEIVDRHLTPSDYRSLAARSVSSISDRRKLPLVVGGSNSFIHALVANRFDPDSDVFHETEDKGFAHHREIIPPPINQGFIGSCSAVATAQCLSATVQMKFGGPHDPAKRPSVQELTNETQEAFPHDCYSAVPGEGGFRGFHPGVAFEYAKQHGVAVEANHPYYGQRTSTPTPPDSPRIRIQDYTVMKRLPGTDPLYFETQPIIRQQPIVGVFPAPESLEQHREGVYQGAKDDDDAKTAGGHAVVIFGYGTENGQDYYWIQNTWGPEWGDNGIAKVSAHLFIYFVYPVLEGISIQEPREESA